MAGSRRKDGPDGGLVDIFVGPDDGETVPRLKTEEGVRSRGAGPEDGGGGGGGERFGINDDGGDLEV